MKQFKMPSKREFQAMYPPGNDAFDCAVRATLDALPENSPNRMRVKRKMSVGLAAAVILVLALTCAAVAAGLGVFGRLAEQTANKGYSELYRALDEKSVSMDETLNTGGQTFRLKQAYADENSLFVAYEMTNMRPVVDYTWMPTTKELAQMEQMDDVQPDTGNEERDAMICKLLEDGAKTGAAGAIWKIAYLSDGAYLAGTDEYLNILSGDETLREDGTMIGVKELELPEKLKNETSIAIEFVLYRATEYDFFDGKRWVQSMEDRTEQRIRVDVLLNANEKAAVYHAERTFPTYSVAVDVTISDVKIHVKANLKSLDGHPLGREKWTPGEMMDGGLYLDGQPMHVISGMDEGLETTDWTMENDYTRPEQLPEKLEWIPCYYTETGTEERKEEAVTIWLTQRPDLQIQQVYVDDDKLFLSYEMTGLYANADYSWQPTDEDDAKMQPIDSSMLEETEDAFLQDFIREMKRIAEQNGRASAKLVKNQCSFGAYLNETGEYLEPIFEHEKINLDGSAIGMKMFELQDMYKNEKILPLTFDLFEEETFYVFDGTHWLILRGSQEPLDTVHVDAPIRSNEIQRIFGVQKTVGTTEIKIDVEISNVTIQFSTNVKSLDGHLFSAKNENWKKGDLAEWRVCIDGEEGVALSGNLDGLETTNCIDEMIYIKPQIEPEKLEWIPSFYMEDGDGVHVDERPEEAVTIWLTQP